MVAFFGGIVKILETASGLNFEQIMNRFFSLLSNLAAIFRNIYDIIINLYSFLARFSPPFLEIYVYFSQYYRHL